ncbi:MAG: PAS domain S-box protein [Desulforhabdus sp.]|jgi:PAS domain S-box-containing protein|nr:PAS domain S-box protein [Desulforhabdus sp.]
MKETRTRGGSLSSTQEAAQLRLEQVKLLYAQAPAGLIATAVNSLILAAVFWRVISPWKLVIWVFFIFAVTLLFSYLVKQYRKTTPETSEIQRWTALFIAGLFASGIVLGSAGIFLFPGQSLPHEVFLAFLLGGMVAGATGTHSVMLEGFLVYSLPVIAPITVRLLHRGTDIELAMAGLLVIFYAIMINTAYYVHKTTLKSLCLRLENRDLVSHLMELKSQAEKAVETLKDQIAERKSIEKALRESEEKYRMIFENSPLGIVHFERDGTVTAYNESLAKISGSTREEFIGLNPLNYLQDEEMKSAIAACLAGEQTHYEGLYRSRRTGTLTPVKADFSPIFGEDGSVAGGTGIIQDISEQKKAEKELGDQLHFLQTLIDTIPNPIFYKDVSGFYVGCNKAFETRLGLHKDQIVGKSVYEVLPKSLADEYHRLDLALFSNPGEQVYETSLVYADGTRHDIILNKATYTNVDGTLAGLVGVSVDITARKQGEQALRRAHDELEIRVRERTHELAAAVEDLQNEIAERKKAEEALRLSSEKLKLFAYSVIHDLKSPAVGIYGVANLLHKHYKDLLDEKGRMYCEQILKASEHVATLVEQINFYVAAKEAQIVIEKINVNEILRMVHDEFSAQLSLRQLDWYDFDVPVRIKGDRLSIHRVFRNLVDNALKYGGEQLSEIRIGYEERGDFHVFSVSDNGVGITREGSEKIFKLFERDRTARGISGTGLGLAIVKEIAERHGGDVWVEPGSERGTTFYISISNQIGSSRP